MFLTGMIVVIGVQVCAVFMEALILESLLIYGLVSTCRALTPRPRLI